MKCLLLGNSCSFVSILLAGAFEQNGSTECCIGDCREHKAKTWLENRIVLIKSIQTPVSTSVNGDLQRNAHFDE